MDESLDSRTNFDKCAEVEDVYHFAGNDHVRLQFFLDALPRVCFDLLEPQGKPMSLGVGAQNHEVQGIAQLQHVSRMTHVPAPSDVASMQEANYVLIDLHLGADVAYLAHDSRNPRPVRIHLRNPKPRVLR